MEKKKKLTPEQKSILFGILLGGGSLQWNNNRTKCRLRYSQKNKEYCFHLYNIFQEYIKKTPKQNNKTGIWYWNTEEFSCFRFYKHQFYTPDGKKKVPRLIHRWLSPRTLFYWYMDNGSMKSLKSTFLRFCTHCFSYGDVKQLQQAITGRYKVRTSIVRQGSNRIILIFGGKNGRSRN